MSQPTFFEWMEAHPAAAKQLCHEWTKYALILARGREAEAKDLVQECLRRVGDRPCPAARRSYGKKTIKRLHLNKVSSKTVHKRHNHGLQYLFELHARPDESARIADARRLLKRIAHIHGEIHHFDMLMDHAMGMSAKDLAQRYDCTEATARQRVHRARVQLLQKLGGG